VDTGGGDSVEHELEHGTEPAETTAYSGAGRGIRTPDLQHGKLPLYH
jgi:hypothetical protein